MPELISNFMYKSPAISFPQGVKILHLGWHFDINDINITELYINFDLSVHNIEWPQSLKMLSLCGQFNQSLEFMQWPSLLDTLILGHNYNCDIHNVSWPKSLYRFIMHSCQQKIYSACLPENLTTLIITNFIVDDKWTKHKTLHSIEFLPEFNGQINHIYWPETLIILKLSRMFNQPIIDVKFPCNLHTFIIGNNQSGDHFNQPINNIDINNIDINNIDINNIDINNIDIYIDIKVIKFPNTLSVLSFGEIFNQYIDTSVNLRNIIDITFGVLFNQDIQALIFNALYIIHDCSLKITINSCKFPTSLYKIIWYPMGTYCHIYDNPLYSNNYKDIYDNYHKCHTYEIIKYQRKLGQYTKAASLNKL
jgi:hypothetical protein